MRWTAVGSTNGSPATAIRSADLPGDYFQVRSVSLLSYDDVSNFSKADKRTLHGYGEQGSKAATPFSEVNVALAT